MHGRFTTVDPLNESASTSNPQSFNRYTYVMNDPLNMVDPGGMEPCSAQFSYQECGGAEGFRGGQFGDTTAFFNREFGGLSGETLSALQTHTERVNNSIAERGFLTNSQAQAREDATDAEFRIWYGYHENGDLWTKFRFGTTFTYSELSVPAGGLNNGGRALISEMGRWGPILQKTTNTMGAFALFPIAAITVADSAPIVIATAPILKNLSIDGPDSRSGRIVGLRWRKSQWGIRLDYHSFPGDKTTKILHINVGSLKKGESLHIPLFDPRWFR